MAYVYFDDNYAPCSCLIVPDKGDPYSSCTLLVQTDYDYPGIASTIGWTPCPCGKTDGTIDCKHRLAGEMIQEAEEFLRENAGTCFPALDDYLPEGVKP